MLIMYGFWLRILLCVVLFGFSNVLIGNDSPESQLNLYSNRSHIQPGDSFDLALRINLPEDWYIYWKRASGIGLPTLITWELPKGIVVQDLTWPTPKFKVSDDFPLIYYDKEITFLAHFQSLESLQPVNSLTITANISWLICKDVCIPQHNEVVLQLPVKQTRSLLTHESLFKQARDALPAPPVDINVSLKQTLTKASIVLDDVQSELTGLVFIPFEKNIVNGDLSQIVTHGRGQYVIDISLKGGQYRPLSGLLLSRSSFGEKEPTALVIGPVTTSNAWFFSWTWLLLLGMAFLGGLILNIMPCVFPVLSIKVLSLIKHAQGSPKRVLVHSLMFASGIVLSCLFLAAVIVSLKSGGDDLGWGFQLQSPMFVSFMGLIFFVLALNFWDVFEVGLGLTSLQSTKRTNGLWSSFWNGVLVMVVATPCTAPFMGTAIGVALAQPSIFTCLIFMCLGLGVAAPYVLFSLFPAALQVLPKPGSWMVTFKHCLGFPLMATVIWLSWVLALQTSIVVTCSFWMGLLIIAFLIWCYGQWGNLDKSFVRWLIILGVLVGCLGVLYWFSGQAQSATHSSQQGVSSEWLSYTPELMSDLAISNKPVFIDFTAAWCLSCQVNKKVALSNKGVMARFLELEVALVRVDWTRKDPEILAWLSKFGRSSVPLYVYYPDGLKAPFVILPELLTPGKVLDYLSR